MADKFVKYLTDQLAAYEIQDLEHRRRVERGCRNLAEISAASTTT